MQTRVLKVDSRDNVLIALTDLNQGEHVQIEGESYTLVSNVPAKHKFATEDLFVGDDVVMYGVMVGAAVKQIQRGERLTTSNVQHHASGFHEQSVEYHWASPDVSRWKERTFLGYHRSDGQVGTRNYWVVVPLVFCENRNIGVLKQAFEEELGFAMPQIYRRQVAEFAKLYQEGRAEEIQTRVAGTNSGDPLPARVFQNIDGIKFLLHEGGCGGTREDANNLCSLIAGYIHHPNVAGATVLSLGCQSAQIATLLQEVRRRNPAFSKPLYILDQQQSGSEFTMLSEAVRKTLMGLIEANKATRAPAGLSHLCVWA